MQTTFLQRNQGPCSANGQPLSPSADPLAHRSLLGRTNYEHPLIPEFLYNRAGIMPRRSKSEPATVTNAGWYAGMGNPTPPGPVDFLNGSTEKPVV